MRAPTTSEATTVPTFSVQTLRDVLAKGQAAHPELACRMERAARLVAFRRIEPGQGGGWWVESEGGNGEYWVYLSERGYRADRCTCPDYQQRGGPCKHAIAVRMLQACQRREARLRRAMERHVRPSDACGPEDGEARYALTAAGEAYLAGLDDGQAGRPRTLQADRAWLAPYLAGYRAGAARREEEPAPAA